MRHRMPLSGLMIPALCLAAAAAGRCAAQPTALRPIETEMVYVPAGPFRMGLAAAEQEWLARQYGVHVIHLAAPAERVVHVPAFSIDKYEVTNRQYRRFVQATGHRLPVRWQDRGYPKGRDDAPVVGIAFEDARAYCRWAGKRLPTEEEWEKAARGTDGRLWPWGNRWRPGACRMDDGGGKPLDGVPADVGSFPQDVSPYGAMDMAGNVAEWVEGKLDAALAHTAVTKGGSFALAQPYHFLCAGRVAQPRGNGSVDYIGFRCAQDGRPTAAPTGERRSARATAVRERPSAPVPAAYRSRPITVHPVADLEGDYQHQLNVYLPRRPPPGRPTAKVRPWRLEVHVPYLPDDRFGLYFELYWLAEVPVLDTRFHPDHTAVTVHGRRPGVMDVRLESRGGLDCLDLTYRVENLGAGEMPRAHETCVQTLAAPNFRDHDGSRTLFQTAHGFVPITAVRHPANARLWCQDYVLAEQAPLHKTDPVVTGPLLALVSRDGRWLVAPAALSGPPGRLANNREYSCLHSNAPSRIPTGGHVTIRERIYFLHATPDELAARWNADVRRGE